MARYLVWCADAAGSILVLMLWVYYASAIFLFGATFTFTRAKLMSSGREMDAVVVGGKNENNKCD